MRFTLLNLFLVTLIAALGFKTYSLRQESDALRTSIAKAQGSAILMTPFSNLGKNLDLRIGDEITGATMTQYDVSMQDLWRPILAAEPKLRQYGVSLDSSRFLPPLDDYLTDPSVYFNDENVVQLCRYIKQEQLDLMNELIDDGVDVNASGIGGTTPLLYAYALKNEPAFRCLLAAGANPDAALTDFVNISRYNSPPPGSGVTLCTNYNFVSNFNPFFELSLKNMSDVNLRHYRGNTLLHHYCLMLGSNPGLWVRQTERSPERPGVLGLLLQSGIDVNLQNDLGETACFIASERFPMISETLIDAGADPFICNNDGINTYRRVERIVENRRKNNARLKPGLHDKLLQRLQHLQKSSVDDARQLEALTR